METQLMCRLRIMVMGRTAAATHLASPLNTQSWCPGVESISRKARSGSVNVEICIELSCLFKVFITPVIFFFFFCVCNVAGLFSLNL